MNLSRIFTCFGRGGDPSNRRGDETSRGDNPQILDVLQSLQSLRQELRELREENHESRQELRELRQENHESSQRMERTIGLLWKEQFQPTRSTTTISTKVQNNIRTAYELPSSTTQTQCFVTGELLDSAKIKTGHIYQKRWPSTIIEMMGIDVNHATNLLFLWNLVEVEFDRFHLCIIPTDGHFVTHVLYPKTKRFMIESHATRSCNMRWADIDKRPLTFPSSFRPAKRLCAFHATMAINYAVEHGWITREMAPIVPEDAFSSPGFDRKIMDIFLSDQAQIRRFTLEMSTSSESSESATDHNEVDEVVPANPVASNDSASTSR